MRALTINITTKINKAKTYPRRLDILNNLPAGGSLHISKLVKKDKGYVSSVLNGRCSPNSEIGQQVIQIGEFMAAVNIWQHRFSEQTSTINPFQINPIL